MGGLILFLIILTCVFRKWSLYDIISLKHCNHYVWPDIWPIFKNVPGVPEKNVYSPIVGYMF